MIMPTWSDVPASQVPPGAGAVLGSNTVTSGTPNLQYAAMTPVNEDVPAVLTNGALTGTGHVGDTLTCTNGNWLGVPTGYAYQWKSAGANVGTNSNTYTPVAGDVGKSITVVVTATNAAGSTAAPASHGVAIS